MSMNIKPENRRLLEALSFIDDSIVSDMLAEIKIPDAPSPERNKKVTRRSIRYFLALAASLVLMSAVIPLITYLIEIYPFGQSDPAAQPTESDFEDYIITETDLAAINSAWNAKFGTGNFADTPEEAMRRNKYGTFYFGRYGYSIVIIEQSDSNTLGGCTMGSNYEYPMSFKNGQKMWVFNSEDVYTPYEAEREGVLTQDHVAAIYGFYQNYYIPALGYWEFIPTLEALTQEEMREVSDAVLLYKRNQSYHLTYEAYLPIYGEEKAREIAERENPLDFGWEKDKYFRGGWREERYYGVFGDCIVVAGEGQAQVLRGYTIEGIRIQGTSFRSYVYRNGEVLELGRAYDKGWLTLEDIARIASRHNNYIIALNSKDYLLGERYLEPIKELEALPKELFEERYENLNTGFVDDDRYLGDIGYCWVFLERTDEPNETESVNIAGYEFYTGKYRRMVAYTSTWDGYNFNFEAHDLAELYREHNIPDVLIKMIYQRNEEYERYFNLSTLKEMDEVAQTHFANVPVDILEFYGTYNGYTVVANETMLSAVTSFEINGYKFSYSNMTDVMVYRGSEKHHLTEAYQKGYITDTDIAKIHEAYLRYQVFYK